MAKIRELSAVPSSPPSLTPENGNKSAVPGANQDTATGASVSPGQFNFMQGLIVGVLVVFLIGFIQLLVVYYSMVHTSFKDYKDTLRKYEDDRYHELRNRIDFLESQKFETSTAPEAGLNALPE